MILLNELFETTCPHSKQHLTLQSQSLFIVNYRFAMILIVVFSFRLKTTRSFQPTIIAQCHWIVLH